MSRYFRAPRIGAACAVGVTLALIVPLGAAGAATGNVGIGDPYYPSSGNPGYNVSHYDLDLSYAPDQDFLSGEAAISATAGGQLSSFNLDLDGLTVASVTVDGRAATFTRAGGELTVKPAVKIMKGAQFVVDVAYSGVPVPLDDAGFLATDDGALVVGQPRVASSWFPANDHPADKATYTISVAVPAGLQAVSNGRLVSETSVGASSVWVWQTDQPMASYLATIDVGEFDIHSYTVDGVDYLDAIDPDLNSPYAAHSESLFAYTGAIDNSYNRLARTITVDPGSSEFSFWINRAVERGYDFAIVEIAPAGTDDWTTLPDEDGILTQDTGYAWCSDLLGQHPQLVHYLSGVGDAPCAPTGTTGEWWTATGASSGWEQWRFDLAAYSGQDVDVAITYVSDYAVPVDGVSVDDIVVPGVGSTSFEDDGDIYDGWTDSWPVTAAGPPAVGDKIKASFAKQPEIIAALSSWFGPYPFDQAGGIVDDYTGLGFALENQTRPVYAKQFWTGADGDLVVVHELAHQWYGDSVALERWSDIWLNEGFASYAEWLWSEDQGGVTAQQSFDWYYGFVWAADDPFWKVKIGDPGPDNLFSTPVYYRGAMTLHALRTTIGDEAFFRVMQQWHADHENGNGTTKQFIALAEKVSGQKLAKFFRDWLYTGSQPSAPASGARMMSVQVPLKLPVDAPNY